MKRRRLRLLLNLCSIALLLFALYLNFVKSEPVGIAATASESASQDAPLQLSKKGTTALLQHSTAVLK